MGKKSLYLNKKGFTIILILPFFCLLFGGMSFAGMQGIREIGIPIQIKEEPFSCGKKKFEPHCRFFMQEEGLRIQDFFKVGAFVIPESLLGFKKSALKFCGSFIEVLSPALAFAQDIPKQGPNKGNCNSRDESKNETIDGQLLSFTLGIISGSIVMVVIGIILIRRP